MIELPGQILALFAILFQVGFALAKTVFHALQRVLNGRDGSESTVTDVGVVGVPTVDRELARSSNYGSKWEIRRHCRWRSWIGTA